MLLPTRDRHELLRGAIETVRRQSLRDWEIVISDNSSPGSSPPNLPEDDRIFYSRSDRVLPVTDNWNRAVDGSQGRWVSMLGDDDGFLPGSAERILSATQLHPEADLLWIRPLEFIWPGVHPEFPEGRLSLSGWPFPHSMGSMYIVSSDTRRHLVEQSMNFRHVFNFNMQYFIASKDLLDRMRSRGPVFQSPYPDYYASCVMLTLSRCTVAVADPTVIIGMSPKSFGHYYFSGKEKFGTMFLKNEKDAQIAKNLENILLPGTDMNNSWLFAMETVARRWPEYQFIVGYDHYRQHQLRAIAGRSVLSPQIKTFREIQDLNLSSRERGSLAKALGAAAIRKSVPRILKDRLKSIFPSKHESVWSVLGKFKNLLQVYESWDESFFSRYIAS